MKPSPRGLSGWLMRRLIPPAVGPGDPVARTVGSSKWEHHLAATVLFLFGLQAVGGLLLLVHYQATATHAHESIRTISTEVAFGALLRGAHHWGSDLLVGAVLAYVACWLARRSYRAPRELGWYGGLMVAALGLALASSGSILPWGQRAVAQARVGAELAGQVPFVGGWCRRALLGGDALSPATLDRAVALHVAILPAMATLTAVALYWVLRRAGSRDSLRDGASASASAADAAALPLYPDWLVRQATICAAVLVALVALATFAPPGMDDPARLAGPTPTGVAPPWYALGGHQVLRSAPAELLGVAAPRFLVGTGFVALLLLIVLPFVDRRGSRITVYVTGAALIAALVLSAYGLA